MKDESYLYEPLLEDGDFSHLVCLRRAFTEKLWGILPQGSAASWLHFPSDIESSAACFQQKSAKEKATMTEATGSPVRRTWVLILVLIIFITFLLALLIFIFSLFIRPLGRKQSSSMVVAKNLSEATLLEARDKEPPWGAMRACLDKAVQEFSMEPSLVKMNAKMIFQCNGTRLEFLSGNGGTHIEVVWINGKADYIIREANAEVHVARLARHPLPLSLTGINEVLQNLASWGGLEELQVCLNQTLQKFRKEPTTVQDNTKIVVSCACNKLTFISGKGQNEISVFRGNAHEEIQYQIKATGWAWVVRFGKNLWK